VTPPFKATLIFGSRCSLSDITVWPIIFSTFVDVVVVETSATMGARDMLSSSYCRMLFFFLVLRTVQNRE
jgi:hypothetical protein